MMNRERKIFTVIFLVWLLTVTATAAEPCAHDFQPIEEAATCTQSGYSGFRCTICDQTKDFVSVPQLGHDWSEWTIFQAPQCSASGLQSRTCLRCHRQEETEIPATAHSYSTWIQEPTCGRAGYTLHTCVTCGHEEKTDRVDALGHDLQAYVVEPSCTKDGYTKYQCSRCTYSRKENPVEKTGHVYDSGTVVKEAGLDSDGKITYTCLNCATTKSEIIPAWDNPFVDVPDNSYYCDSVTWAYHTGITTGSDKTHFSPDAVCTRAQVVTFLWRWAGCPATEEGKMPFSDVQEGVFYYDAVRWAVEKGITNGVDKTHFAPDAGCTRGQVVTLLHRYMGSPILRGSLPFEDVAVEDYYSAAVLWAYKNQITTGVDTTHFAPDAQCIRAQIVTFLYRLSEA